VKPRLLVQVAAFALSAAAVAAEPRLFYTAAERMRVTADRAGMLAREARAGAPVEMPIAPMAGEVPASAPATAAASAGIAGPPRLQGVSLKDDGRSYAWIGGRRYREGELIDGRRLRILRNGVQLVGVTGPGRLHRIGEAIPGAARE
jgi:hypothetical protein